MHDSEAASHTTGRRKQNSLSCTRSRLPSLSHPTFLSKVLAWLSQPLAFQQLPCEVGLTETERPKFVWQASWLSRRSNSGLPISCLMFYALYFTSSWPSAGCVPMAAISRWYVGPGLRAGAAILALPCDLIGPLLTTRSQAGGESEAHASFLDVRLLIPVK